MRLIEAYDMVLTTQNDGRLYPQSVALARSTNTDGDWVRYIERVCLPTYRRDLKEPNANMTLEAKRTAAAELRGYYARHILEIEA